MCARGYFYNNVIVAGTHPAVTCDPCPADSYCPGGNGIVGNGAEYGSTRGCGENKVTKGTNAGTEASCLAAPAYSWSGTDCSTTTDSTTKLGASYNPGYNRLGCRACPANMIEKTTSPDHTTLLGTCTSKLGWYWDTREKTVKKCAVGTYKATTVVTDACTPCPKGRTTTAGGTTSQAGCSVLLAGYKWDGTSATMCDADSYRKDNVAITFSPLTAINCVSCNGGNTGEKTGARTFTQCAANPGYGFTAGATSFTPCTGATYSAGGGRKACTPCPTGFVVATTSPDQTTFEGTCMLQAGHGTIPGGAGAAQLCPVNTFSMYAEDVVGVRSAPCQACPTGTTTLTLTGKTSFDDCVISAGWGYDSATNTAQKCAKGSYGIGGNTGADTANDGIPHPACVECGVGLTTLAASGSSAATECVPAAGWSRDTTSDPVQPCDVGTYKVDDGEASCSGCGGHASTPTIGATSGTQCTVCEAGYGGGGGSCALCSSGTYSPSSEGDCKSCGNGLYTLPKVSRAGSVDVTDCIERMGAVAGGYDYIAADGTKLTITSGGTTAVIADVTATTVTLCAAACNTNAACMYFYFTTSCKLVLAASDTNAVKVGVKVDAATYTRWDAPYGADDAALPLGSHGTAVDIPATAHTSVTTIAACEALCEAEEKCALYVWTGASDAKCFLRVGATDPAITSAGVKALADNFGSFST